MEDTPNQNIIHNKIHVERLLTMGIKLLADIFRERYKILTGNEWTDSPVCAKAFFREKDSIGRFVFEDAHNLEKQKLRDGKLRDWDLTILKKVIHALARENSRLHADGWRNDMKKIQDLVSVRHEVAHPTAGLFEGRKFGKLRNKLEVALVALGGSKDEILRIDEAISKNKRSIPFNYYYFRLAVRLSKYTGVPLFWNIILNYLPCLAWSLFYNAIIGVLYLIVAIFLHSYNLKHLPLRAKFLITVVLLTFIIGQQFLVLVLLAIADMLYRKVRSFGRQVKETLKNLMFLVLLILVAIFSSHKS